MSLQDHTKNVGKLGGSTQVSSLSVDPPGKVGASTMVEASATQVDGGTPETGLVVGHGNSPDEGDLTASTPGTLIASGGMFGDLPDLDLARMLEKVLRRGVDALADYILDRIIKGLKNGARNVVQTAWDRIAGFPDALQRGFERVIGMRELNSSEIGASQAVHGGSLINYSSVRVMPSSFFTKMSDMRAFVSFNIIHYPHDQLSLAECVHECTHVAQYQAVGARYIPEAIHAQHTGGYSYGNLGQTRKIGKTYKDFNREQQAQIAGDYYRVAVQGGSPSSSGSGTVGDYTHYITQMRSGSYW
jgi:hypothetical protein